MNDITKKHGTLLIFPHEWLKPLQPDEPFEGWGAGKPSAAPEPKEGMKVIGAWWD